MTNINTITSIALFKNQTSFVLSNLFLNTLHLRCSHSLQICGTTVPAFASSYFIFVAVPTFTLPTSYICQFPLSKRPYKKKTTTKQTSKKTLWAMCGMCEHWFIRQPCINCFKVSLLVFPTVYIDFLLSKCGKKMTRKKNRLEYEPGIYRILSTAVCIYESSVSQQSLQALLKYTISFLKIWNLTQ